MDISGDFHTSCLAILTQPSVSFVLPLSVSQPRLPELLLRKKKQQPGFRFLDGNYRMLICFEPAIIAKRTDTSVSFTHL